MKHGKLRLCIPVLMLGILALICQPAAAQYLGSMSCISSPPAGLPNPYLGTVTCNGVSGGTWGSITGTLTDQTDLTSALNAKIAAAASGNQTITGAYALNIATGTFNVGRSITYDSELTPGVMDAVNFFGAIGTGSDQAAVSILGERPAGVHGEALDVAVNCTGTQSGGNGCVGAETDAYTSLNFTVNTPYLFGNAAFAEHDSAGTVSTAMGSFMAVTNSRTGSAPLNAGFYSQSQAGVSATANAQFSGVAQGASATTYSLYFPGTGTGDKALFGSSLTAASLASSGSNGGFDGTEGTCAGLTAASAHDLLCPNSTAHRWQFSNNNGAFDSIVGLATTDVLTNKTLTTPTIGSFTNATHNHQNAAGGGTLDLTVIGGATILPPANGGAAAATSAGKGYFWGCAGENGQAGLTMQNAAGVQGANIIETCQFVLDHSVTVNKITISVTNAAGTAATCDAGVYNTSGTLLVSSNGGFNGNSATTQTVAATPLATVIPPGVYIYGWACTTATTILNRVFALDTTVKAIMNSNSTKFGSCSQSATSGILNASCTVGSSNSASSIIAALFEP